MEGLKRLIEALVAAGATTVFPCIAGYPPLRSPQELQMLPDTLDQSDSSATSVHIFSSCPMGENTARCATDSYGRVHGTDDLYIADRSEEHTSELQSLMRISYAVFCLKKKIN